MYQKSKRTKIGDISLDYRDYQDIFGIVEIFALNVYHAEMIKRGDAVLDLGAGIGDFGRRFRNLNTPFMAYLSDFHANL